MKYGVIGAFMVAVAAGSVLAGGPTTSVEDINSVRLQNRRFNDFPDSMLTVLNVFPTVLSYNDISMGGAGFANQHFAGFSATGGATNYQFQNNEAFLISYELNLSANTPGRVAEAGFRFDTIIGGEAFFIAKTNGEVAAFGGPFPFFSFGGSAYTPGTTATMGILYTPGTGGGASTIQYIFNGVSSGPLAFGNTENGLIDNSIGGVYVQGGFNMGAAGESFTAIFTDFQIIPAPGAAALLGLGGLVALRRRR